MESNDEPTFYQEDISEKQISGLDLDSLFLEYEKIRDDIIKKIKTKINEHLREKNNEIELLKNTLETRNKTIDETREKLNRILSGLG